MIALVDLAGTVAKAQRQGCREVDANPVIQGGVL